ncbi:MULTISPECIES: peroxiredoxin [unclassified Tessaracoccus]|uniref:peroxiredoxin n=1 Tax=unclassified Tessaracoccus TaxID=2635419 RepID=UPI00096EC12D|nr:MULTISPECIES: peroxiredoxin [unclassified Tessaracoccus]MBB1509341.1 peroxiredoxin [Tessaracoccus sp. MC1756]MCG6567091.1 peroxiredoxin [Tessaracoccus sp. ZS01]OMG57495.1 peroxiredoxin [Tessaracoccus sp. ZS01]
MTARLTTGTPAPDFTLPDEAGNDVSLSSFAGRSVILYFYPAAMTPGCTTQAVDFSASLNAFQDAGYTVLGCSPDDVDRLAKFKANSDIEFTLLADPEKKVHNLYGAYGVRKLYGKEIEGVLRSTFVIDVDDEGHGLVRVAQYNVKATGHVAKLRRELGV